MQLIEETKATLTQLQGQLLQADSGGDEHLEHLLFQLKNMIDHTILVINNHRYNDKD